MGNCLQFQAEPKLWDTLTSTAHQTQRDEFTTYRVGQTAGCFLPVAGKNNVVNANKTTKTKLKKNKVSESLMSQGEYLFRLPVCRKKYTYVHECPYTNMYICRLEVIKVYYSGSQAVFLRGPFWPSRPLGPGFRIGARVTNHNAPFFSTGAVPTIMASSSMNKDNRMLTLGFLAPQTHRTIFFERKFGSSVSSAANRGNGSLAESMCMRWAHLPLSRSY